ncbi:ComEC/Rec2 family competence protein [Pontiella sp.]|uniref:ComEC/Rec2 family competence protein n=1 Tax=Pontiella sp. TaxID=2837462 RepID=UPI003562F087
MDFRPHVRRPLVGVAIAASAGMLLAAGGLVPAFLFFILALLCVVWAAVCRNAPRANLPVFCCVALIAACRYMAALPNAAPDAVEHRTAELGNRRVQLVGTVAGVPRFYAYERNAQGTCAFVFQCREIGVSNHWKSASGAVEVRIHSAPENHPFEIGDRLELRGVLSVRDFPGRHALELQTEYAGGSLLRKTRWPALRTVGETWRSFVAPRLEQGIAHLPVQVSVLKALVLGYRSEVPNETLAAFRRTGSMHIFAISGLHVGIVGLLLALALKFTGVTRDKMGLILIPVLGLYVVSTGMKSSALRALLMAVVYLVAPLFRRKPDIPTSVAVAALVLLFFQPLEILEPGFIFSFTVVIFLVMAFGVIPQRWVQGPWLRRYTVSLVVTSVAAGTVALPMAALFFGNFSPVALIGNLVVVPLTFCIVLCGWLSILLTPASAVFNAAAVVFIDLLLGGVGLLDRLPGSSFRVQSPPVLAVLLWYAGLIALFTHARRPHRKWAAAGVSVLGLLLALFG